MNHVSTWSGEDILACPGCGGAALLHEGSGLIEGMAFFVGCRRWEKEGRFSCSWHGPSKPTPEEAISAWNSTASLRARLGDLELMLRAALSELMGEPRLDGLSENDDAFAEDGYRFVLEAGLGKKKRQLLLKDDGTGLPVLTDEARAALEQT